MQIDRNAIITGAAALVVGAAVTYGLGLLSSGVTAQSEDEIETVVRRMLELDGGADVKAALTANTSAITSLSVQVAGELSAAQQFRAEYRQDQRAIQAALVELSRPIPTQ